MMNVPTPDSPERERLLFDHASICIHEVDLEGRFLSMNPAGLKMLGLPSEEAIVGLPLLDTVSSDDRERVEEHLGRALAGKPAWFEMRPQAKGRARYFASCLLPVRGPEGRIVMLLGLTEDRTETLAVSEALERAEGRFRTYIEKIPVAIFLADRQGRYVEVNDAAADLTGYSTEELISLSIGDLLPTTYRKTGQERFDRLQAEGVSSGEIPFLRKDGREILVDVEAVALGDDRFLALCLDVTEARQVEAQMTQFGRILEDSLNEIFIFDAKTLRFVFVNRGARENLGYSMEELRERTPISIKPELTAEDFAEVLAPLRAGESRIVELHTVHERRDGSVYPVEVHVQSSIHEGRPVFVAIILDLTEKKRAEEERLRLSAQVQHAQKLESLGVLAGGIAHDFNNILMAILGNTELALSDLSGPSPVEKCLREIDLAARRAAGLAQQMLAFAGRGRFGVERVDLNKLVEEMSSLLEVSIAKNVSLKLQLDRELPRIEINASQLCQIVMNLITNASEAIGEENGEIVVETGIAACDRIALDYAFLREDQAAGNYVFLDVRDTGCGLDDELRQRIFDPFFTTKFAGRGLGLAATLGIVRSHDGAIRIDSEPGAGTSIRVLFPEAGFSEMDGVEESTESAEPSVARDRATILVVDDEQAIRDLAARMLSRDGFEVLLAADGREALEVYRERGHGISCVLLDLTMPRMGGEATFRELRRLDPSVKIVLSSGFSKEEIAQRFSRDGPLELIQKPFRRSKLSGAIERALSAKLSEPEG